MFDDEGKMVIYNGIVNGYYYVDGTKTSAGLIEIDGSYYYVLGGGLVATNRSVWVSSKSDTYYFGADGKMITGRQFKEENGVTYYYEEGRRGLSAGLVLIDGAYYYITSNGTPVVGKEFWVEKTNGLMAKGTYTFDAEGKLVK